VEPFFLVELTGADVFWLAARALAETKDMQAVEAAAQRLRAHDVVGFVDELHLRGAILDGAHLEGAFLNNALLEHASLNGAYLEGARLWSAHLKGARLREAHLESAELSLAHLEGASLDAAHLEDALLNAAHLEGAHLSDAHLEGTVLAYAHLENAFLHEAHLEGAILVRAHLEGADLEAAYLGGKRLSAAAVARIRRLRTDMRTAVVKDKLPPANLQGAFLNGASRLKGVTLGTPDLGFVSLADVHWGDVNLAVVDWTQTTRGFLGIRQRIEAIELGEERAARQASTQAEIQNQGVKLEMFKLAVRANRQLATALRSQGLNEDADRFAYKAQKLQREVLRRQQRYGAAFGSWFLDVIAGYGYRPMRSLLTYALVVLAFAIGYFLMRESVHPALHPVDALIFSVTSFHGRGFMPGENVSLHNPLTIFAAIEAIIGLLIEISFIATFTQRFFAR
jgi:uncharacterized protein YjbI with pentapeptide repeats